MTLRIDGRLIGPRQRTLVIAEIGVNHDGSMERAVELVHLAAASGADAVKFQVFRSSTLMHPSTQFAAYQAERVSTADASEMLRQYELDDRQLADLISTTRSLNLLPIATPFSLEDVTRLAALDLPVIKIASPDLVNVPLLQRVAQLDRPMLISTGAATMDEVAAAVDLLNQANACGILMHCVSSYPAPADQAQLCWMDELAGFAWPVGYSDHTTKLLAGALAVAAGACVIEKHLTYDCSAAGPDHSASASPRAFAEYVRAIRAAEAMLGVPGKHVLPIESDVRTLSRQSLVLARDVEAGQVIGEDDLRVQRPGTGIGAAEFGDIIGLAARTSLPAGTLLKWEMLADAA